MPRDGNDQITRNPAAAKLLLQEALYLVLELDDQPYKQERTVEPDTVEPEPDTVKPGIGEAHDLLREQQGVTQLLHNDLHDHLSELTACQAKSKRNDAEIISLKHEIANIEWRKTSTDPEGNAGRDASFAELREAAAGAQERVNTHRERISELSAQREYADSSLAKVIDDEIQALTANIASEHYTLQSTTEHPRALSDAEKETIRFAKEVFETQSREWESQLAVLQESIAERTRENDALRGDARACNLKVGTLVASIKESESIARGHKLRYETLERELAGQKLMVEQETSRNASERTRQQEAIDRMKSTAEVTHLRIKSLEDQIQSTDSATVANSEQIRKLIAELKDERQNLVECRERIVREKATHDSAAERHLRLIHEASGILEIEKANNAKNLRDAREAAALAARNAARLEAQIRSEIQTHAGDEELTTELRAQLEAAATYRAEKDLELIAEKARHAKAEASMQEQLETEKSGVTRLRAEHKQNIDSIEGEHAEETERARRAAAVCEATVALNIKEIESSRMLHAKDSEKFRELTVQLGEERAALEAMKLAAAEQTRAASVAHNLALGEAETRHRSALELIQAEASSCAAERNTLESDAMVRKAEILELTDKIKQLEGRLEQRDDLADELLRAQVDLVNKQTEAMAKCDKCTLLIKNMIYDRDSFLKTIETIESKLASSEPTKTIEKLRTKFKNLKDEFNDIFDDMIISEEVIKSFASATNDMENNKTPICTSIGVLCDKWETRKERVIKFREQLVNLFEDSCGAVRVYIRIKPSKETSTIMTPGDKMIMITCSDTLIARTELAKGVKKTRNKIVEPPTEFGKFYGVFGPAGTNEDVYNGISDTLIRAILDLPDQTSVRNVVGVVVSTEEASATKSGLMRRKFTIADGSTAASIEVCFDGKHALAPPQYAVGSVVIIASAKVGVSQDVRSLRIFDPPVCAAPDDAAVEDIQSWIRTGGASIHGISPRQMRDTGDDQRIETRSANGVQSSTPEETRGICHSFDQVKDGYSIVLFGYGLSGSGKTYGLLGKDEVKGMLHLGLEGLKDVLTIQVKHVFEEYKKDWNPTGAGDASISGKVINLIGNLTSEKLGIVGRSKDCYKVGKDYIDNTERQAFMTALIKVGIEFKDHTITEQNDGTVLHTGQLFIEDRINEINKLTRVLEKHRFAKHRLRKTPNNNLSSRSHLYMVFEIVFQTRKTGYITIIDSAGRENPNEIHKLFIDNANPRAPDLSACIHAVWSLKSKIGVAGPLHINESTAIQRGTRLEYQQYPNEALEQRKLLKAAEEAFRLKPNDRKLQLKVEELTKFRTDEENSVYIQKNVEPNADYYSFENIHDILVEGIYINESINHMTYFFQTKSGTPSLNFIGNEQVNVTALHAVYNPKKLFVNPAGFVGTSVEFRSAKSRCHTIPILTYLDGLNKSDPNDEKPTKDPNDEKPTKYVLLLCVRSEAEKCIESRETLEFGKTIKST